MARQVAIDGLTGVLADVQRLLGPDCAVRFAATFGGRRLRIPGSGRLRPDHPIVACLGADRALVLCQHLGGREYPIPTGRAALTATLCRALRRAGWRTQQIASESGLDPRHVRRLVEGISPDPRAVPPTMLTLTTAVRRIRVRLPATPAPAAPPAAPARADGARRPGPMNQVTLSASIDYNPRYAPADAKKAYVAKITGRQAGAAKFAREFLGDTVTVLPGDEGLYERQNGLKKGGAARYYHVVLTDDDGQIMVSKDCEALLPQIAARLDKGEAIADIVAATEITPREGKCPQFTATIKEPPKKSRAGTKKPALSRDEALAAIRALMAEHGITAADLT